MRPDTVLVAQRHVDVRYEENVSFGSAPTTLAGFLSELPFHTARIDFLAINQSQSTSFNRPELGLQGNSTLTTGVTGRFNWDAAGADTSLASRLPFGESKAASHFSFTGEIAHSNPQFLARNKGTAYIETFDANGGTSIALADQAWYVQQPSRVRPYARVAVRRSVLRAVARATLVWQTNVQSPAGARLAVTRSGIDPLLDVRRNGIELSEPVLWLTLLPLDQVGRYDGASRSTSGPTTASPRQARDGFGAFAPCCVPRVGSDARRVSRVLDAARHVGHRARGEVGSDGDLRFRRHLRERRAIFSPDTLKICRKRDTTFGGRSASSGSTIQCRRPSAMRFRARSTPTINDTGLPGDVADTIVAVDASGTSSRDERSRLPRRSRRARRHRRSAHRLHGRQQQARRRRHRSRQRAQLLERAARERAAAALRRRPERAERRHARRRPFHRHAVRSRPAAAAHAATGFWCACRSRRRPIRSTTSIGARCARLRLTLVSAQGQDAEVPVATADRRAAGRRRAVAGPEQPDAGRDRGHSPGRRVRHHLDDRHDRLERVGRVPAASGRRERGRAKGSAVPGHAHRDQRELAANPNGELAALPPRRGVFPFSRGPPVLHGVPAARRVGARRGARLGPGRRAADVLQGRPRREQLLHVPRAGERGADRRRRGPTSRSTSSGSSIFERRFSPRTSPGASTSIACTGVDSAIIAASPLPSAS